MQSAGVVDLFDVAWKPGDHVSVSSIVAKVDLLTLNRLHETLGFAIVVAITAATHRCRRHHESSTESST